MAKVNASVSERMQIVVDHSKTLEQMVDAGRYDFIHPCIGQFRIGGEGIEVVWVRLVHLGRQTGLGGCSCAVPELMGYPCAPLSHLLALGATYPKLQLEFPIVAAGSVQSISLPANPSYTEFRYGGAVACLGRHRGKRQLCVHPDGCEWRHYYRFLVLDTV